MRIVIVDADAMHTKLFRFILSEAGHTDIVTVQDEPAALAAILGRDTDLVLLDVALPWASGIRFCQQLREQGYAGPVIFVSQQRPTHEKIAAFTHGADDFIEWPFDPREFLARLQAVVRRCRQITLHAHDTVLRVGSAQFSISDLTFRIDSKPPVRLTPTEMQLLECLMRNSNMVISRQTLIERTWGADFVHETNRVDVYIRRLREKIEENPSHPTYLLTVRGAGYVFRPPESTPPLIPPLDNSELYPTS